MPTKPRRSALFLPATNQRATEKARAAACDVVILDLEDAVGPEDKASARAQAVASVQAAGFGRRELVVRANGLDTPFGRDDLAALRGQPVAAVLMPKVSSADDIAAAAEALGGSIPIWAMVETCAAILRLDTIAAAPALDCLVLGANDLAKEMRCTPGVDRAPLQAALALTVTAARAHGRTALDSVFNAIEDIDGLTRQCEQAAAFGFDGKTLIHPAQLEACNRAFSPSEADVAFARAVVALFARPENAAAGVLRLNGAMVERLHLEAARRTLALADA